MATNKKKTFLIGGLIVIVIEILVSRIPQLKNFDLKNFLETVPLVVTVLGVFSESKKETLNKSEISKNYQLNISFESGMYGGVIGGIVSGTVIALILYFQELSPPLRVCLEIIPYCACIGCLFGILIFIGRLLFVQSNILNDIWANFFGCLTACVVAGMLSGMLGMALFGREDFGFIGYGYIVLASVIGALGLICGSLLYDYEGKIKYIVLSLIVGLVLSFFISMIGFLLINDETISYYLRDIDNTDNLLYLLKTGCIIGVINGFVFGLVIGFTVVFYKYWKFADKQRPFLILG